MDNKKRITLSACALFIMLGLLVSGIVKIRDSRKDESTTEPASSVVRTEVKEESARYVLKIEDGIVVVFNEDDMTRPILVTDIYASTLRNYDRESLERGITAENEQDLHTMLEDFSS